MRNTILSLLLCLPIYCLGQLAVTDATANTSLAKSVAQAVKQVENGVETLKVLKDAQEVLSKVNNAVRDLTEVKQIYTLQKTIISDVNYNVNYLRKTNQFSSQEMGIISNSYNFIVKSTIRTLESLEKLLTNNIFKMSDAERMKFIKDIRSDIQSDYTKSRNLLSSYKLIASERQLKYLFKKD